MNLLHPKLHNACWLILFLASAGLATDIKCENCSLITAPYSSNNPYSLSRSKQGNVTSSMALTRPGSDHSPITIKNKIVNRKRYQENTSPPPQIYSSFANIYSSHSFPSSCSSSKSQLGDDGLPKDWYGITKGKKNNLSSPDMTRASRVSTNLKIKTNFFSYRRHLNHIVKPDLAYIKKAYSSFTKLNNSKVYRERPFRGGQPTNQHRDQEFGGKWFLPHDWVSLWNQKYEIDDRVNSAVTGKANPRVSSIDGLNQQSDRLISLSIKNLAKPFSHLHKLSIRKIVNTKRTYKLSSDRINYNKYAKIHENSQNIYHNFKSAWCLPFLSRNRRSCESHRGKTYHKLIKQGRRRVKRGTTATSLTLNEMSNKLIKNQNHMAFKKLDNVINMSTDAYSVHIMLVPFRSKKRRDNNDGIQLQKMKKLKLKNQASNKKIVKYTKNLGVKYINDTKEPLLKTIHANTVTLNDVLTTSELTFMSAEPKTVAQSYMPINFLRARPLKYAVPLLGYGGTMLIFVTLTTNSFIVIVLLHKHMRTPTNTVLACMAISDMLTGLFPLPWMIHFYMRRHYTEPVSAFWCNYYYIGVVHIPTIFHTASIWLITSLAVQRYLYVCYSQLAKSWCTIPKVLGTVLVIYTISTAYNLPRFFEHRRAEIHLDWNRQLKHWGFSFGNNSSNTHPIANEMVGFLKTPLETSNNASKNLTNPKNTFPYFYYLVKNKRETFLKPGTYMKHDLPPWSTNQNGQLSNFTYQNIALKYVQTNFTGLTEAANRKYLNHSFKLPYPIIYAINSRIGKNDGGISYYSIASDQLLPHCSIRVAGWLRGWENIFYNLYYWFRVVFVHVVPCTTLVVLNGLLIHAMRKAIERRKHLLANKTSGQPNNKAMKASTSVTTAKELGSTTIGPGVGPSSMVNGAARKGTAPSHSGDERKVRDTNATTYMLVLVVTVFLIVEIPLGIMFILHIIQNTFDLPVLDYDIATVLITITDFSILASYPINFFIYCRMSKQFRDTFNRFLANTYSRFLNCLCLKAVIDRRGTFNPLSASFAAMLSGGGGGGGKNSIRRRQPPKGQNSTAGSPSQRRYTRYEGIPDTTETTHRSSPQGVMRPRISFSKLPTKDLSPSKDKPNLKLSNNNNNNTLTNLNEQPKTKSTTNYNPKHESIAVPRKSLNKLDPFDIINNNESLQENALKPCDKSSIVNSNLGYQDSNGTLGPLLSLNSQSEARKLPGSSANHKVQSNNAKITNSLINITLNNDLQHL